MKINEIIDQDEEHQKTLDKTGFWGKAGAGCIIVAKDNNKFLIPKRSSIVEQPNTWGVWGGAIDKDDTKEDTVYKEVIEETGYTGKLDLVPLYIFEDKKTSFKYFNFLAVIENEFEPILNWESSDFVWCEYGKWPSPLHFGLKAILDDSKSISILKKFI